ncbi:hypothetical protein AAHA92_29292 [Salvia divinorum]|uniref:Uncharacterized protein n=1 Tax=Salvia divinorum TaxID=28513 RepID=A0ABD1FXY0_SALDI
MDQVMAKADELRDTGIKNPDYDAIYLELFGKMKKRKQIPGAGQATGIYFPHASSSSATFAAGGTFGILASIIRLLAAEIGTRSNFPFSEQKGARK